MLKKTEFLTQYRQEDDGTWTASLVINGEETIRTGGFASEAAVIKMLDEFVRRAGLPEKHSDRLTKWRNRRPALRLAEVTH